MYYCVFSHAFGDVGKYIAFIPLGALFLFIGMYLLASTADLYLSPALETLTVKFKLSDSFAGVTMLALGNGAPDVFSAIAAATSSGTEAKNATKSVSILLGGTFFITCVVLVCCTHAANVNTNPNLPPIRKIKVTPVFFVRDVLFYLFTCIYLLIIMLAVEFFDIYLALVLLIFYSIYVATVVLQSKKHCSEECKVECTSECKEENIAV